MLNKNGHCISYDKVLAVETIWVEQLMSNEDGYATPPSNIQSSDGCLVQAIADNGYYGQEENSQHITNIVLEKRPSFTEGNFSDTSLVKERRSFPLRRSIKITPSPPLEVSQLLRSHPQLPPYYASIGVETLLCQTLSDEQIRMRLINQAWILARSTSVKHFDLSVQHVPGWTGFNVTISSRMSLPRTVGNCRSIPAAPTYIDIIYTMLYNVPKMLSKLNQNHQVLTIDEGTYETAKEVQWKVSPQFEDMIIRLEGFHRAKNFLGVIGRRMEETGIEQILEELFGPSQISSILKGSKYNRGIAAHKSLVEMLLRRKWKSFREWGEQKNDDSLNELIGDIAYQIKNFTSLFVDNNDLEENHQLCLQLEAISACLSRLNVHWIQIGQFGSRLSKTFQYWDEYVSMVLLLFDFIEAEREANWYIQTDASI